MASHGAAGKRELREATRLQFHKQSEDGFVAFTIGDVSNSGGTRTLHLKNAASNSTNIDVKRFIVATEFTGEFFIYDSFSSAPSGGTTLTIDNLRMDSAGGTPDSGAMEANENVSFTEDGQHIGLTLPGGGSGGANIGGELNGTEPIIEPDREIVCEITNTSSSTNPGSIAVVYLEREDI